jgi:hypothetical protein
VRKKIRRENDTQRRIKERGSPDYTHAPEDRMTREHNHRELTVFAHDAHLPYNKTILAEKRRIKAMSHYDIIIVLVRFLLLRG